MYYELTTNIHGEGFNLKRIKREFWVFKTFLFPPFHIFDYSLLCVFIMNVERNTEMKNKEYYAFNIVIYLFFSSALNPYNKSYTIVNLVWVILLMQNTRKYLFQVIYQIFHYRVFWNASGVFLVLNDEEVTTN